MLSARIAPPASPSPSPSPSHSQYVFAQPRLDSHLLSPPLTLSPFATELQISPTPVKEKRRKQVPASSRGGLGNIRARKQSMLEVKNASVQSPSSASSRLSTSTSSTSRIRRVFSVGSNSTMSSPSSLYSNIDSVAATVGSGAASVMSGSSGTSEDYVAFSDPGSPLSASIPSPTPTSGRTKGKGRSKPIVSASAEYALHLQTDARQRALGKHLAKERAKEESRLLGQVSDLDDEKVVKTRMGRGGAGVYKTVESGVDPTLHPRAATIAQEYEARAIAQERELIAASRVRAALKGSTGRGGAGNVGIGGKTIGAKAKKEKKRKEVKGKGKARADAEENVGERTAEAREDREDDDDATVAIDDSPEGTRKPRKKRRGLRKLLRRVIHPNANTDSSLMEAGPGLNESTPRPSLDNSVLNIGHPSSQLHSVRSSPSSDLISPLSSPLLSPQAQNHLRPRNFSRSKEGFREGAELLAFVNAALPDLPSARHVLGVPGTPGFPHPGRMPAPGSDYGSLRSHSTPSSSSATPLNGRTSSTSADSIGEFQEVGYRPFHPRRMEVVEEDWVDDETLQENGDGEHTIAEEDEEEDSDIDPQLLTSAYKKEQQYALPKCDFDHHPDSLDAVIRVALDKLDRTEIKDGIDDVPVYDEAGIIDAYTTTGDGNDGFRDRRNLHSAPIPAPLVLPSAPRYLRVSAPVLPARFHSGSRVIAGTKIGAEPGKYRAAIPVAGPPPTGPVPRLPEQI